MNLGIYKYEWNDNNMRMDELDGIMFIQTPDQTIPGGSLDYTL